MPVALTSFKGVKVEATAEQEKYKKEFTYLAAYSYIKQAQKEGSVDKVILERLNKRCAERMDCKPIPL